MANRKRDDDDLAYGEYHGHDDENDRSLFGDVYNRFRRQGNHPLQSHQTNPTQLYQPHLQQQNYQSDPYSTHSPQPPKSSSGMSGLFDKVHSVVHGLGTEIKGRVAGTGDVHGHTHESGVCPDGSHEHEHRFHSFAPPREGNDVKWYVDGCGYMWAVSRAIEQARESIWILDWWLSPELYLRRPPARHEEYRIDRMLKAAAERGVKVNIIVYKEVTQALTLSSAHTKHLLEKEHPNIAVFRHPDHLPDRQVLTSSFVQSFQNMSLTAASASKLPGDALKAIYGAHEGTVLYWAHHEKLCLVDGHTAFMGGLDLCYGRWDTNQHPIADAHPGDLNNIVFPGQDFNNARVMDFQDVANWQNNKLDRSNSSRMGWTDVALCLSGPVVQDLQTHFIQRWNFIYDEKYTSRNDTRYTRLSLSQGSGHVHHGVMHHHGQGQPYAQPSQQGRRGIEEDEYGERGFGDDSRGDRGFLSGSRGGFRQKLQQKLDEGRQEFESRYGDHFTPEHHGYEESPASRPRGGAAVQLTRSCAKWSHGVTVEHSIADAYINVIRNSQHFIYIENQFFITATGDQQKPIKNRIGAAIVERITRAARAGERFKVTVLMPAVPAFAGDLKGDDALGTRAIMEFQYDSINRGGHSIMEEVARAGFNPMEYIRFYNLRSYDRINSSAAMKEAEQRAGIPYEEARKQHDVAYGGMYEEGSRIVQPYSQGQAPRYSQRPGYEPSTGYTSERLYGQGQTYQAYQQGAQQIGHHQGLGSGRWDSVSECYMLGGEDIRNVPWEQGNVDEIDAFVSEELYIHSKLLIADDRIVICGSANLNDRSQLGDHDSEIAVVIEDPTPLESSMNGRPWRASKFAGTLRRQIFRKHLGLIPAQDMERPDANFEPVGTPNIYDYGSREDQLVADPLDDRFINFWNTRARTNTEAFGKLFHPVPYDGVRNWKQYDEYYSRFFAAGEKDKDGKEKKPSKYKWGHVVAEEFPGGIGEVKEWLSRIKGTLVEMPLLFLKEEDIAKEGLGLNAFTEEVYT
ncbi:phospholipase D/nuclease [Patellaria atrata CBS 101060]|uniref:Phospholipase n=1 Tax=Patellaria atrata CBS 101060 TaxID=1346257 RepID=A0A9P4S8Y5_9PEZI|nr:phospholipase D/nuclease [Patellaria atrata CBS 101060]